MGGGGLLEKSYNTINTRCCVGVGQAIYTEVVNQQDTTRQSANTRQLPFSLQFR